MEKMIVRIKNLSFDYGGRNIFNDFNLEIKHNTFVAIIGKNGSGKSTLAKVLAGFYNYDGYINIDGYLLNKDNLLKIRRSLSVCFEDVNRYFVGETVRDDLAFSLENLEYSKKEISSCINNVASKFKLENILEKGPLELTDSEKVKVMLASSLIHNPKILLLDNSLYMLNASDKKLVFKVLRDYQKNNNLTIILITNNLEDTLLSDRVILLNEGKIVYDESKEEIYKDEKLEKYGFSLPFIVKLSHNLILYDLLDKVYFDEKEAADALWN